jgi:CSLREA domain-containing protein
MNLSRSRPSNRIPFVRLRSRRSPALVLGIVALLLGATTISGKNKAGVRRGMAAASAVVPASLVPASSVPFEAAGSLAATFDGDSAVVRALLAGKPQPFSLASEDLNGDGVADLVVGYAVSGKGALAVYLGNREAFVQGIAAHTSSPFLPRARVFGLPQAPDFLATGDFNGDGFVDLLVGTRGSNQLYLLAGDGTGNFSSPRALQLPGTLTAFVTGQIGLRDTFSDVAVGVTGPGGSAVALYKGALGGLTGQPLVFPLDAPATEVAIGDLDGDQYADLAIVAQGNIYILHGRDWKTDAANGNTSNLSGSLERLSLPFSAKTLTLGNFIFDRDGKTEMAVLTDSGTVSIVARGQLNTTPLTAAEIQAARLAKHQAGQSGAAPVAAISVWQPGASETWSVAQSLNVPTSSSSAGLIPMEMHNGGAGHGVLMLDSALSQLHLLSGPGVSAVRTQNPSAASKVQTSSAGASSWSDTAVSVNSAPVAALPMRLSGFGRAGLVTLHAGQVAPAIVVPAGDPIFTVNVATDSVDANPGDGICADSGGHCSLRAAVMEANANAACATIGNCTINFSAGLNGTPIQLTITEATGDDPNADASSGDLDINTNLIISGNGPTNTIIQGNFPVADGEDDKIFGINQLGTDENLSVTIDNLTVEGGRNSVGFNDPNFTYTGGGIDFFLTGTTAAYTLSNCVISANTNVHGYGGGVNVDSGTPPATMTHHGTVQITNCTISNNQTLGTASAGGAGELSEGGGLNLFADIHDVTITGSTISGNSVAAGGEGGGLFIRHTNGGNINIHNSVINGNSASSRGGGISIEGLFQAVTIDQDSIISNNVSGSSGNIAEGGGIYVTNASTATTSINQVTVTGNSLSAAATQRGGGGIAQGDGNATIQFSRFFGNTANSSTGSGFHKDLNAGTATVTDNWWGCNSGPSATPCDVAALDAGSGTVTFSPWLVLSNSASPTTILTSGTSTLTASFLQNNLGATVSNSNVGPLVGVPVTFNNAVLGAISGAAASIQSSGTATATFTAGGTAGTGHASATVDNATVAANITIDPGPATHFAVSAPGSATAGSAFSVTVTALDVNNNPATGYSGTVHFTSTDGAAVLPANSTLTNGVGTFSATLKTAGNRTIAATDTVTASITGTSSSIAVAAATATHFTVSAPASATGSLAFSFTVTALDPFNNTATGYSGTAHFTSTDGAAVLPANSTLTNGVGTFSTTLKTAGNQTITATDTVTASITGTSGTIVVTVLPATHFAVSAPATATAGSAFSFTVTALDVNNSTATGYAGTVHFTSSDGAAVLPANSTLTNGVGTFSATLKTAGNQTITATDTVTTSITGTSSTIALSAAAATHFTVSAPASATAGTAISITVTGLDQFNNTAAGYTGTVHFTSSDGAAVLPANSTLTNGVGTFSATLKTAGSQTVTATDTVTASITGTSSTIAVTAAAATHFAVAAPASASAGVAFSLTVTALDPFNNAATGYTGVAHFTSSDGAAVLPANSVLTNGVGTFSATLKTAGSQTVTATDTVTASITGISNAIAVSAAAATHFVVSAPASATAGSAFSLTVTALDAFNNTATGYSGVAHFTSSDGTAVLPANSTLTSGVGTFSATLKTAGNQTITTTDTVTASITGTSNAITVAAAAATHFMVSAPGTATANSAFAFTVTALDPFNNVAASYAGSVHFTSTDGAAVLPANSTLTNGAGTFSATLKTAGNQTITAKDAITPAITGTSGTIAVTVLPATHFAVSAPATATAGSAFNFTVTALDVNNSTVTSYTGIVHFTSSDGAAVLAANSALTNGVGTFAATLKTAGNQTIAATDTVTASITGASNAIAVSPAAATHLIVTAPATAAAGSAFSFAITALDSFNNTATGYAGTVRFSSTDAAAVLPANSSLVSGVGTFSATLKTGGNQTITATDTVTASIAGASGSVLVTLPSDLTITGVHSGNFFQGQIGATYHITVSNVGANATVGAVTVTDTLPAGLTATAISGAGWTCNIGVLSCTRNDALLPAASYPAVTVTVNVAANAPASVTNMASVSGGGELNVANDTASDVTTITAPPDFALSFTLTTITVKAGQVASYGIDVTPQHNSFTNPITFTATGLPAMTSFVFNPSSVTPGANPASSALVVTTIAGTSVLARNSGNGNSGAPLYALLLPFAGLVLSGFRARKDPGKRGKEAWTLFVVFLAFGVVGLYGCAGSSHNTENLGTPAGTYTVTITATSGTVQHSAPVTLTVQP